MTRNRLHERGRDRRHGSAHPALSGIRQMPGTRTPADYVQCQSAAGRLPARTWGD